jgi:hypothetical protein
MPPELLARFFPKLNDRYVTKIGTIPLTPKIQPKPTGKE